jgi:hypothetical protein
MNCHSSGRLRGHYPINNAKHREDIAGNKQQAPHTLGLSRQGVSKKIKRLRIQAEE